MLPTALSANARTLTGDGREPNHPARRSVNLHFQSAGERRGTVAGSASTAETGWPRFIDASSKPFSPRHAPPQQFRLLDCTSDSRSGRTGPMPSGEGQIRSRREPGGSWRRPPRQSGQFADSAQVAVPALRTERRILARDPLIERLPVLALVGLRSRSRRGGIEQGPATLQLPLSMAIGVKAVVTMRTNR